MKKTKTRAPFLRQHRQPVILGNYAEVELANNKGTALIDAQDVQLVSQFAWSLMGKYAGAPIARLNRHFVPEGAGSPNGRFLYLHHLIGFTMGLGKGMDHINGNRMDNRRSNLRAATPSQQQQNRRTKHFNSTGFKGVIEMKGRNLRKPYYAHIKVNGEQRWLGNYATPEEAARAYDRAARQHFGAYAHTNFRMIRRRTPAPTKRPATSIPPVIGEW